MNMNTPQIPWNPVHPAMIPLTQETIETGLSCIKALREKFLTPTPRKPYNKVTALDNSKLSSDKRKGSQVVADIAALSSLDNQKLGLYQHA